VLMRSCETWAKSLIRMRFEAERLFLWITLLTTAPEAPQALEIQGFGWNAWKTRKEK